MVSCSRHSTSSKESWYFTFNLRSLFVWFNHTLSLKWLPINLSNLSAILKTVSLVSVKRSALATPRYFPEKSPRILISVPRVRRSSSILWKYSSGTVAITSKIIWITLGKLISEIGTRHVVFKTKQYNKINPLNKPRQLSSSLVTQHMLTYLSCDQ
jgi:hypothetical protein